jgi:hypothetical protein
MILVFNYGLFVDRETRNQEKGENRKVESKNRPDNIRFASHAFPKKSIHQKWISFFRGSTNFLIRTRWIKIRGAINL